MNKSYVFIYKYFQLASCLYLVLERSIAWYLCTVDVIVTLECIHLYVLCIVPRCLFQDVCVNYLSHFLPQCLFWEVSIM